MQGLWRRDCRPQYCSWQGVAIPNPDLTVPSCAQLHEDPAGDAEGASMGATAPEAAGVNALSGILG